MLLAGTAVSEESVSTSLFYNQVFGLCIYEDDWESISDDVPGDADGDGDVDLDDFVILKSNFGAGG